MIDGLWIGEKKNRLMVYRQADGQVKKKQTDGL